MHTTSNYPRFSQTTGRLLSAALWGWLLLAIPAAAVEKTRIAVLEFELIDLTPLPGTPEELERTASLKPRLENALQQKYRYQPVEVNAQLVREANAGVGYLFEHHNLAAQVGRGVGADWVVIGRTHKPSFLFAYIMVHLVNAETGRLEENIIVEVKGSVDEATARGMDQVARKIHKALTR